MRYSIFSVIASLMLWACDFESKPADSTESIQYEGKVNYPVGTIFSPPIFSRGFEYGHEEKDEQGNIYEFRQKNVGELTIPSGNLVIAEPLYFYDQEPIDVKLKAGTYPVVISEALIYKGGKVVDKRNALAKIVIDSGEAESWEYIWTFGVDGGTGGYIDYQVMKEIISDGKEEKFSNDLLKEFELRHEAPKPFHENHDAYHQYVNLSYGTGNLIAFSSGWGDEGYHSYIGYDRNGKAVEILTDLSVIGWNDKKHLTSKGTGRSKAAPVL